VRAVPAEMPEAYGVRALRVVTCFGRLWISVLTDLWIAMWITSGDKTMMSVDTDSWRVRSVLLEGAKLPAAARMPEVVAGAISKA
jgi:hypothetical protein